MKIGEIKIEALKLMFVDFVTDYAAEDLTNLSTDDSCRDYLANMPGAINRCFSDLERRGIVPVKRFELKTADGTVRFGRVRYLLPGIITDFQRIERVVKETAEGDYNGSYAYLTEGDTLVLKAPDIRTYTKDGKEVSEESETYTLIYHPRLTRVTGDTNDEDEVALPENIASLIPYYIKGDLFRMDEPDEAQEARNQYEAGIAELIPDSDGVQMRVESVYAMEDEW